MPSKSDALAAEFYSNYINKAKDENVVRAMQKSGKSLRKLLKNIPKKKIDYAYEEGKWTIREVVQHMIDAERVFAYRALSFARKDTTPLPSFDENSWTANSLASSRNWKDLINEFTAVREASILMFDAFSEDQLRSIGVASNKEVNVLALGYIIAGHVEHHIDVIRERYLGKKSN